MQKKTHPKPSPTPSELKASRGGTSVSPHRPNTHSGVPLRMVTGEGCPGGTERGWLVSMGGGERHPTPTVPSLSPPLSTWPGNLWALPALSCPQPSQQGKGPLVGVARGREKREQKERTLLLKLPQAHESLRESHPVPFKKGSLLCKCIFLPRPQTHFPFSSQSWDWAPASPREEEMLWA